MRSSMVRQFNTMVQDKEDKAPALNVKESSRNSVISRYSTKDNSNK